MMEWRYQEPTNLQLAVFLSIYSVQHSQLRHLKTTPVRIEQMIASDPVFRRSAMNIHRHFCEEMDREIKKMMKGELRCSYTNLDGRRCIQFNQPGSYRCAQHEEM